MKKVLDKAVISVHTCFVRVETKEYAEALERANLWKMRAKVATALATYFCEIANYAGGMADIKREGELQADRLVKMLKKDGPSRVQKELALLGAR